MNLPNMKQKYIFKIHTKRLKNNNWNMQLSLEDAVKNNEIIPIANNMILRFIEECSSKKKTYQNTFSKAKESCPLFLNQFQPDYMCLVADQNRDYLYACKHGFSINGITYCRLLATNGGVKQNTVVFVNKALKDILRKRIDNGRNPDIPLVPAKYSAYEALTCSSTVPVSDPKGILVVKDCYTSFFEDVITLDDSLHEEPDRKEEDHYLIHKNCSDGYGTMTKERAAIWSKELGLSYVMSGCNTRYPFLKGMLVVFDHIAFAEQVAGASKDRPSLYFVEDLWGNQVDVRTVDVIITQSMLKLWNCYSSIDDYLANCHQNHYPFCIAKTSPEQLEHVHTLNYQFIQSYPLSEEDLDELMKPTVEELHDVLGEDVRKSILFAKGTKLTPKTAANCVNDCVKAVMIDQRIARDHHVKNHIRKLLDKKIQRAKTGCILTEGNYQIACGDPYALWQSIFQIPVTGLLKKEEIYSKYWEDANADEIVCFRAPMTCHNNIRKMKVHKSQSADYWFRDIKTMILFNPWDSAMDAMNGEDADGDLNFTTDNPVLLRNTRNEKTIFCIQRKAKKQIITEEALINANMDSFGDKIGQYTNGITSQFEVQAGFAKDSKEYEELNYRIMCGQLFQQNAIDKAKGILAKPRPKEWYHIDSCRVKEDDPPLVKEKKEFNQRIAAYKKPYFMQYIYPDLKKAYKKYCKEADKKCRIQLGIPICDLSRKENRTKSEELFLHYYEEKMPVGIHPCTVNRICWHIEQEFDSAGKGKNADVPFDPSCFRSNTPYSQSLLRKLSFVCETYHNLLLDWHKQAACERMDDNAYREQKTVLKESLKQECESLCPDKKKLTDAFVDLCYSKKKYHSFLWDICSDTLIENLLDKHDRKLWFPMRSQEGEITYGKEKFSMKCIRVPGNSTLNENC